MIQVFPFELALKKPFVTAKGTTTHRRGVLVRNTVGDFMGWGEGTPMPGLSRVTPEDLYDELRPLHGMEGVCLDDLQSVQHYVDARVSSAPAKHALSAAILDTMAQHRGVSLARLLHTEVRRDVPISHLYEDDDRLFHATMLGTQTVKIKVGIASLSEEVARVSAVREIVGPSVHLRLDANGAWSRPEAEEAIAAFARLGVRTIEDPVNPTDFAAMASLRHRGIDIAADEGVSSVDRLAEIIAEGAADVAVFKPMRLGSLLTCMGMMNMASNAGLEGFLTTTIDGAVGRMTALHLAAASPLKHLRACGLNTAGWLAEDNGETPEMSGSHVDTPEGLGLGLRIRS